MTDTIDSYRQALLDDPGNADALAGLGGAHLAAGRLGEAALALLAALERCPGDEAIQALLCRLAERVAAEEGGIRLPGLPPVGALLALLSCERVDLQDFAFLVGSHLRQRSPLAPAFAMPPADAASWLASAAGAPALADPVLLAVLARLVNLDAGLEAILVALRQRILQERLYRAESPLPPVFLAALARQNANNEYIWPETPEESAALAAVEADILQRLATRRKLGGELAILAAYRPPERLAGFSDMGKKAPITIAALRTLIEERQHLAAETRKVQKALPVLTPLSGPVSEAVARQYEENPYPRWLTLAVPEPGSRLPEDFKDRDIDVLIAGCGTGKQAVRAALGYGPGARVLAVDLSRASLAYASVMAKRFKLANLSFAQADILALGGLETRFDIIECTGVLHHMRDPVAGWRVLAGLLAPEGRMRIALYSRAARAPVQACRQAIVRRGIGDTDAEIRAFRAELLAGGGVAPELARLTSDMFSLSAVRDLLFHVQESTFTLPEIQACLDELGLIFDGFGLAASVADRLLAEVGAVPATATLADWQAVEIRHPATFRQMYQFSCRKASATRAITSFHCP